MITKREQKVELSSKLAKEIKNADGVVLTSYKGLTFLQLDSIRRAVKATGSDFRVVKNTVLQKAFISIEVNGLDSYLKESTALIIAKKDFPAVAKILKKYAKDYNHFDIKAGYMAGSAMSAKDVAIIADLPPREQLLATLLATMNAPAQNFVSVLANIPRSLLNVLNAVKEKKD